MEGGFQFWLFIKSLDPSRSAQWPDHSPLREVASIEGPSTYISNGGSLIVPSYIGYSVIPKIYDLPRSQENAELMPVQGN